MTQKTLDFRKRADGAYEVCYNNNSIGVSFFIPSQYSIDDYKDKIVYLDSGTFKPYDNLLFNITSSPEVFTSAQIDSCGGVSFKSGLVIDVNKEIEIKENKESTLILNSDSPSLSFDAFYYSGNEESTIIFEKDVRKDEEKMHEAEDGKFSLFYFFRNKDTTISFRDDVSNLHFVGRQRLILYPYDPLFGNQNKIALYADQVRGQNPTFLFGNSDAKLSISSDHIELDQATVEMQDHCFITLKNKERTSFGVSGANFTIGVLRGYPESNELKKMATKGYDFPTHELSANVESFSVVTNGTSFSIYGNNYIEAKSVYTADKKPTRLGYVDINANKNKLLLEDSVLIFSDINLKSVKEDELVIKKSDLIKSKLTNFNSLKINDWRLKGFEANNLYASPSSKIKSNQIDVKSENLTLDKKATLDITGTANTENSKKNKKSKGIFLSNVIVNGKTTLDFEGGIECHNTIFDNLYFKNINKEQAPTNISNSTLKGNIEGEGIKMINQSEINNSTIRSRRGISISIDGEYLNEMKDFDSEFVPSKDITTGPYSTNKLEIL